MNQAVKILLLEDQPDDVQLILHTLRRAGFEPEWQNASTRQQFEQLLAEEPDIILADYRLVDFDALEALNLLHERERDIPFIVVTGFEDEAAYECLQQGAADYLRKDRLHHLGSAVRKALDNQELKQKASQNVDIGHLNEVRQAFQDSEQRYRTFFDNMPLGLYRVAWEGVIIAANPAMISLLGYPDQESLFQVRADSVIADPAVQRRWQEKMLSDGFVRSFPMQVYRYDGSLLWVEDNSQAIFDEDGRVLHFEGALLNISERRRAETAEMEQRNLAEALADTVRALSQSLNLQEVLDIILENVGRVVPHEGANIMLIDSGIAEIVRFRGYDAYENIGQHLSGMRLPINQLMGLSDMLLGGDMYVVKDTREVKSWVDIQATAWIRSYVAAPIKLGEKVIGFLNLDSSEAGFFSESHGRRLQAFAEQAAMAIRNAQLYEAEQRRHHIEQTLRRAAAALNSTLELEEVLIRILDQLGAAIPHDSASVQRLEGDDLVIKAVRGFRQPADLVEIHIPIDPKFPNAHIVTRQEPVALADIAQVYPHFHEEADTYQTERIRSWLGVPLIASRQVIGVITVDRHQVRPFTAEEIDLAMAFASHAAIAMENAGLYEQLARQRESLEKLVRERTAVLQRTTDQVQAILNNSPDTILLLDNEGQIESGNPAVFELLGYRGHELHGRLPQDLVIPAYAARLALALRRVLIQGQKQRLEVIALRKDGQTFSADAALAPILKKGQVSGLVCSLRDISPLKEVERMKDAFVSNVSHELRTPITTLRLNHDLLQRNPSKSKVYMTRLKRDIERLNLLIEDLLRLSRLDQNRGDLTLVPCDVNEIARQFSADRQELATSMQLNLELETEGELLPVLADAGLLGQAISILLTNAFTYTPQGGRVLIKTRQDSEEGQPWVGLSIIDSGPGIPEEEKPQIFERFFRGRIARESGAAGTGLGLSIAYEIVKRHQGRIEVSRSSFADQGACFTIWLPATLNSEIDS